MKWKRITLFTRCDLFLFFRQNEIVFLPVVWYTVNRYIVCIRGYTMAKELSFSDLAHALANDYESIYVIDSSDDSYVEYSSEGDDKELVVRSSGANFYEDVPKNCRELVWPEDQGTFLRTFRKENMTEALKNGKSFDLRYRLVINNEPQYYYLKVIRMQGEDIIIGVQNVDRQTRRELEEDREQVIFGEIARSLGSLFEVIYYIDIETGKYMEYCSSERYSELGISGEGDDFFRNLSEDIEKHIYPDDRGELLRELEKSNLLDSLNRSNSYQIDYRQFMNGDIQYLRLIAFRRDSDSNHLVIAVRNVDAQFRHEEEISSESKMFSDIATALAQRYEVIYRINIHTNEYTELRAKGGFSRLKAGETGGDFFETAQYTVKLNVHPEDYPILSVALQKENLLSSLADKGEIFLRYRIQKEKIAGLYSMFAIRPEEDSDHIIIAVANVGESRDTEQKYGQAVGSSLNMLNRDTLTGLYNKRFYAQTEMSLDTRIANGQNVEFAIVLCDVNGVKEVNSTQGRKAGDQCIVEAGRMLRGVFKDSEIYRVGGDDFLVLLCDEAYKNRKQLINNLSEVQLFHRDSGSVSVAYGMAEFDPEKDFGAQDVVGRAIQALQVNKNSIRGLLSVGSTENLRRLSTDEKTIRFYDLYVRLVSAMTDLTGNIQAHVAEIENLLVEISSMLRLSKAVTRVYRNPQEEAAGGGETLCCFDTGIEGKEVMTLRVITSVMSIATMTVYMAPNEEPLTDDEYWKVELAMRTTLTYISRNRLKDIVSDLAYYDDAGYLNHRSYFNYIMKVRNEIGGMVAVMYNLLHFSQVNQELGREKGDLVMKNHFETMRKMVGEKGIVCRLGGDNFVALFGRERMGQIFGYLTDAPVVYDLNDGKTVSISTSVGVYRIPNDIVLTDPGVVMEHIIVAYGAAKHGGKDRIVFYDESLISARDNIMKVQRLFPEALKNEEFQVYYQPKVHTGTGEIIGAEALCRWFHDGKMVSPGEFIPALEETDDICKLDFYMLDHVCRDIRRWMDQGRKIVRISVNLSRKHLMNRNLLEQLLKIIDKHNIPHSSIEIELTETTTDVAFSDLRRIVTGLQSAGIFASVDDFGIGYSSLNLIRELPWNVLKVDRSLLPMDNEDSSSVDSIMFRNVISMVNELGIECIVEGVETEEQLELLRKNRCHYAQGFLFDRPLPVSEFEERMMIGYYPVKH